MKLQVFLLMAFAAFVFASCENTEEVTSESTESASLEMSVLAASDDSTTTSHARKPGKKGGHKTPYAEIEIEALPTVITSYIATNYVGSTINKAARSDSGYYKVHIILTDSSHVGLKFDEDGEFMKAYTHKTFTTIDISALPAAITAYITTNYEGAIVSSAKVSDSGKYVVKILKADENEAILGFNSDGTFISDIRPKHKKKRK